MQKLEIIESKIDQILTKLDAHTINTQPSTTFIKSIVAKIIDKYEQGGEDDWVELQQVSKVTGVRNIDVSRAFNYEGLDKIKIIKRGTKFFNIKLKK